MLNQLACSYHFLWAGADQGTNVPLPKKKFVRKELGEDAYSMTPFSMTVTDGVGGSSFSSHYISNALSLYSSHFVQKNYE